MAQHSGMDACSAEGFTYPHCLCTEFGAAEIARADQELWQKMFGPNGTQANRQEI
jgi:hypothetical protein